MPVTVIQAGPCVVLQKKDTDNDGYESIQIGFDDKKEKRANKPELGHAKKKLEQRLSATLKNFAELKSALTKLAKS